MTLHAPLTMPKEAFLAWIDRREERYEWAGGRVIMMVRVRKNHSRVTTNLMVALRARLAPERHDIAAETFAVDIGESIRFPDIVVEPAQADGGALEAKAPILIAEVVSPSTIHIDFGDKLREYMSLPTLDTYIILSADEPRVWVWQRAGGEFPPEPEIIEGTDKQVALPALATEIPLAELYRAVR